MPKDIAEQLPYIQHPVYIKNGKTQERIVHIEDWLMKELDSYEALEWNSNSNCWEQTRK